MVIADRTPEQLRTKPCVKCGYAVERLRFQTPILCDYCRSDVWAIRVKARALRRELAAELGKLAAYGATETRPQLYHDPARCRLTVEECGLCQAHDYGYHTVREAFYGRIEHEDPHRRDCDCDPCRVIRAAVSLGDALWAD